MTAPAPYIEVTTVGGRHCTIAVERIVGLEEADHRETRETGKGCTILLVGGGAIGVRESYDSVRKLIGILAD